MATATVATATGAAVLLYYMMTRRTLSIDTEPNGGTEKNGELRRSHSGRRSARRPAQAPANWFEAMTTLSETLRFTYSETLGKWPIGDLAFGINFLLKKQGNLHVASVYAGSASVELREQKLMGELIYLLKLLTMCMHFSKKPFDVFLECTGYNEEDVLLQEPKAGLLKPAFTILADKSSKCFLLLIRGTHSIKDTLTAATGAVVPFHHSVLHDGGFSNLVLGYAHCGMVAAARWIAKLSTPCLLKAVAEYPDYKIKVVMKRAQNVARAVVRTRSSLSSWSCMGARRRTVGNLSNSDPQQSEPMISSSVTRSNSITTEPAEPGDHSRDIEHDETEEDGLTNRTPAYGSTGTEDMTEEELWHELEKELQRKGQHEWQVQEEEEAAMKEMNEEDENRVSEIATESKAVSSPSSAETQRFYPPGRIMHIVSLPLPHHGEPLDVSSVGEEKVGIYETPRNLYSKIKLSRTMINDHYMPAYKRAMELLISQLEEREEEEEVVVEASALSPSY